MSLKCRLYRLGAAHFVFVTIRFYSVFVTLSLINDIVKVIVYISVMSAYDSIYMLNIISRVME